MREESLHWPGPGDCLPSALAGGHWALVHWTRANTTRRTPELELLEPGANLDTWTGAPDLVPDTVECGVRRPATTNHSQTVATLSLQSLEWRDVQIKTPHPPFPLSPAIRQALRQGAQGQCAAVNQPASLPLASSRPS